MSRLASVLFCVVAPVFLAVPVAHASLDLQFGNMTALDMETNQFSIDVQLTGLDDQRVAGFQMDVATSGMEILGVEPLSALGYLNYGEIDDGIYRVINVDLAGNVIEPEDDPEDPIGLYRLDLLVTQSSGPLTIELFNIVFTNPFAEEVPVGQDSYSLTIPAPATLSLVACGLLGSRRRRLG